MTYYFASTYGSNAYTTNNYNGTSTAVTTNEPTAQPTQNGSILANTGFNIALAVGLASLIIVIAVLVRYWKRPATASV